MTTDERLDVLIEILSDIVPNFNEPEYTREALLDRLGTVHQAKGE